MKINLETFKSAYPCQKSWFTDRWGEDFEFDSISELIKATKQLEDPPFPCRIVGLLQEVPELLTQEALDYIKGINPDMDNICDLLATSPKCQTEEMFEYFMTFQPSAWDVVWVIRRCPEYQTKEKLAVVHSLSPTDDELNCLKVDCPQIFIRELDYEE